jgi:hypothetical protein
MLLLLWLLLLLLLLRVLRMLGRRRVWRRRLRESPVQRPMLLHL